MKNSSTVQITHFSDSIVLSSELDNEINTMSLIELLARLNYRLWKDYKILIRGGVTMGKLIHEENGPLFGPAITASGDAGLAPFLKGALAVVPFGSFRVLAI